MSTLTIRSHYPDTVKAHGLFWPDGDGKDEATLDVTFPGNTRYNSDTGAKEYDVIDEWQGDGCGVKVIERLAKGYVWISAVDADGIEHTTEFPIDADDIAFGFLSVTVT